MTKSRSDRRRIVAIAAIVIVLAALVIVFVRRANDTKYGQPERPEISGASLPNPGRGQYLWFPEQNGSGVPSGISAIDSYARFSWKQIEPDEGDFNFVLIDKQLVAAKERGGTFSFRIMPVETGTEDVLPSDLSELSTSWTAKMSDGTQVRVPDWNDPTYLSRWGSLMKALGDRYGSDPRLGYVDVGGYGNWGEGHNWPFESRYPGPGGQRQGSVDSVTKIAASVINNFPKKHISFNPPILKNAAGETDRAGTYAVLKAVLASSQLVGIRNDCLGGGETQGPAVALLNDAQERAEAEKVPVLNRPLDRWRVAPFITEWCPSVEPGSQDASFAKGDEQVKSWHVSQVSNANFNGKLEDYSRSERSAFMKATESAGYRIGVKDFAVSGSVGEGPELKVTWANDGSSPTYSDWNVTYDIMDSSGAVKYSQRSSFAIKGLLGGGDTKVDNVTLTKTDLPKGDYRVVVQAAHPNGYFAPMHLSSGHRTESGAYDLGKLAVS